MAPAAATDTANTLRTLVDSCHGGAEGFRAAAASVSDPTLERLFESYGEQLAEIAAELGREAARLGEGTPARSRGEDALAAWSSLRVKAGRLTEAGIISACERGFHLTAQAFQEALRLELPWPVNATMERVYLQVKESHTHLRMLQEHTSRTG